MRAAKCWKNNPGYILLSKEDAFARQQKLFSVLMTLRVSGLSKNPCKSFHSHKYGLTSIANKKSSFLPNGKSSATLKDRPLLQQATRQATRQQATRQQAKFQQALRAVSR